MLENFGKGIGIGLGIGAVLASATAITAGIIVKKIKKAKPAVEATLDEFAENLKKGFEETTTEQPKTEEE